MVAKNNPYKRWTKYAVDLGRIELPSTECKSVVLPLNYGPTKIYKDIHYRMCGIDASVVPRRAPLWCLVPLIRQLAERALEEHKNTTR